MEKTEGWLLLSAIGKKTFIKYYESFKDLKISEQEMINILALDPQKYTPISMANKTSSARSIFKKGLEIEALQIVLESKADLDSIEKAKLLLDKELKSKRKK